MNAYVVLRDNPYMAKTDCDGRFIMKNLPTGHHRFQFWHERVGYLNFNCSLRGVEGKTERGRVGIQIRPGANELEKTKLSPALFE